MRRRRPRFPSFLGLGLGLGLALAVAPLSGCIIDGNGGGGPSSSGPTDDPAADIAQWNQLTTQLEAGRSMFLGPDVDDLSAVGDQLFWLDSSSFDPSLHRYDDSTGAKIAYGFGVGGSDTANFRASANLVVTADPTASPVVYHAYDANAVATEIDEATLPTSSGVEWSAYAVSGSTVYLVDESTPGATTLLRWTPGGGAPAAVTTLESAGATIGEFEDFGVQDDTMVFIESGRIWKLDIPSNTATWLMNQTEVSGAVDFESDGVLFESASGLMFFDYSKNALTNLSALIDANTYRINATFATASNYLQDFARWRGFVLYIGDNGLFAYDMTNDRITPILLSPESSTLRVDYRYPVALNDGTAFVTGLTSTDGAVGADGPTYQVDLNPLLE